MIDLYDDDTCINTTYGRAVGKLSPSYTPPGPVPQPFTSGMRHTQAGSGGQASHTQQAAGGAIR